MHSAQQVFTTRCGADVEFVLSITGRVKIGIRIVIFRRMKHRGCISNEICLLTRSDTCSWRWFGTRKWTCSQSEERVRLLFVMRKFMQSVSWNGSIMVADCSSSSIVDPSNYLSPACQSLLTTRVWLSLRRWTCATASVRDCFSSRCRDSLMRSSRKDLSFDRIVDFPSACGGVSHLEGTLHFEWTYDR